MQIATLNLTKKYFRRRCPRGAYCGKYTAFILDSIQSAPLLRFQNIRRFLGFCPRPPSRLRLWTPLGDGSPRPPNLFGKILRALMPSFICFFHFLRGKLQVNVARLTWGEREKRVAFRAGRVLYVSFAIGFSSTRLFISVFGNFESSHLFLVAILRARLTYRYGIYLIAVHTRVRQ